MIEGHELIDMSDKNSQSFENRTPFWKRKSSSLPGSSVKQIKNSGPRHKLTFKEFEDHTDDAWDATDDDLLKTLQTVELNKVEQIRATAQAVIDEHSKLESLKSNDSIDFDNNENINEEDVKADLDERFMNETVHATLALPSKHNAGSAPKSQSIRLPLSSPDNEGETSRLKKFNKLINSENTDLDELKRLSWHGIPSEVRPLTWQLLSSYLPANKERREGTLKRKRADYYKFVKQYFESRHTTHHQTYQQIHIDIPRTNPLIPLFQQESVQNIFERLLFVWAVRHPASGYVQGINDLVTPFFIVFLSAHLNRDDCMRIECFEVATLGEDVQREIEADAFWCVTHLLDGIQDNYTFAQPGVQRKVNMLRELTKRVDVELHNHLEGENLEYIQFAFRWMNNLLMREIPLSCTIRLWDTYLAETDGFSHFHIYVCAAFLKHWRNQLLGQDFQGLMLMIQNVPTRHWASEEMKMLLAESYRLKYTFADSRSHLTDTR